MAKTILELTKKVLGKLRRLPGGQTIPADQSKIVTEAYEGLYQELLGDQLVDWASDASIPENAVYPIMILLCGMTANDFGVPDEWSGRYIEMILRLGNNITNPYIPATTEFENL